MSTQLVLSMAELDRVQVISRVARREMTQQQAGELLGLCERQVRRLVVSFRAQGARGLASRRRGRPSNNRLPDELRSQVIDVVKRCYADFGPTLAQEKLAEQHGLSVSVETLRQWLIRAGLWIPRAKRQRRSYQPRSRRACYGELVQMDGCRHHWFEDRGPQCTLLVFVDDATGELMELRFAQSEAAFDYFAATRRYLKRYGKPVAFYSDRLSVFHVNARDKAKAGPGETQFGRALRELNIELICANSPQAKGRVERANLTLQDRLVKELRLAGVARPEDSEDLLERFRLDYNARFGRTVEHDVHRRLTGEENLDELFTMQCQRRINQQLTINYKRCLYLLEDTTENRKLRGAWATVCEREDGSLLIKCGGRTLPYRRHDKLNAAISQGTIVANKHLGASLAMIAEKQKRRDEERLTQRGSLREKQRIRAAQQARQ